MSARHAIVLTCRNASSDPVKALWQRAGELLEAFPSMERQGYPPHLTLVICDGTAPEGLTDTIRQSFADAPPCRITFDGIRRFSTVPNVLWLHPSAQTPLHDLHGMTFSLIVAEGCDPLYQPARWEPHCTLATGVLPGRKADASRLISEPFAAFEVLFDHIELVSLPSVDVIASVPLRAAPRGA